MALSNALILAGGAPAERLPGEVTAEWARMFARSDTDFLHTGSLGPFTGGGGVSSGTITGTPSAGVITGNHPGVARLTSSTTANSGYRIDTALDRMLIGGGERFDVVFYTPAAFTNITIRAGFRDNATSADAVDGAYFELSGSGAVVGKTSSNSTRTTSSTIATLSTGTWYHLQIRVNDAATSVTFEIYNDAGVSQGNQTNSANIPTASGRETGAGVIATNSGTTATVLCDLDYMAVWQAKKLVRGAL